MVFLFVNKNPLWSWSCYASGYSNFYCRLMIVWQRVNDWNDLQSSRYEKKPTTDITPAGCSKHWATSDSWWAMSLDWDLVHSVPLKLRARQCHLSFNVICERWNGIECTRAWMISTPEQELLIFIPPTASLRIHSHFTALFWSIYGNSSSTRCIQDVFSIGNP